MGALERRNLDEVSFVRPLLIVLLVLYHSFAIYDGAWDAPDGFVEIPAYRWIAKLSYAVMLEMFVFISGYLWAFQRETLGRTLSFWKTIVSKFNRLMIPCIVFSSLYWVLLNRDNYLQLNFWDIIGGVGHLWFLPMLFWCFVFGYALIHMRLTWVFKLLILCALAALSILPLPFRIGSCFQYLIFFVGGYYAWIYKKLIINKLSNRVIGLWGVFIIAFICLSLFKDRLEVRLLEENSGLLCRAIFLELKIFMRFIFSSIGVLALYLSAVIFTKRHHLKIGYIEIGKYCMGVYIFQQFIIKYLVYYTQLSTTFGFRVLPWVVFFIALPSSLLLSYTVKSL